MSMSTIKRSSRSMRAGCPCPVEQCPEYVAFSMMTNHLEKHARGLLPESVPSVWLQQHRRYVCRCNRIVAESFRNQHDKKCTYGHVTSDEPDNNLSVSPGSVPFSFSLPSLNDVMTLNRPTLKHIPVSAPQKVGRILSDAIKHVLSENTVDAWTRLLMLPKCVLPSAKRAGRKNDFKISINDLCDRWSNGDLEGLWTAAVENSKAFRPSQKHRTKLEEAEARLSAALDQAEDGYYNKACRILSSDGLCPNNNETWTKLKLKHPGAPLPLVLSDSQDETIPLNLSSSFDLMAVLHSFPRATACGPSGLRVQHLINACEAILPTNLSASLRHLVNLLISGKAPQEIAPFLAGGSLTALLKNKTNDWDVRPIAVGEVYRRLTAKCLCSSIKSAASEYFDPIQLGVACRFGTEKIIHRTRVLVERNWNEDNFCLLKVDMANAFNSVCRQTVLNQCLEHFPSIYKWVSWCYGKQPHLWHQLGCLNSAQGVQQGDPLGPFLFALALHPLLKKIKSTVQLDHHYWYLDDGIFAGHKEEVLQAYKSLQKESQNIGLIVQPHKCELFHQGSISGFDADIKHFSVPNIEILGSPIGEATFCQNFVHLKCQKARKLLDKLTELHDPQVSVALLRSCASFCRVNHLARTIPPGIAKEAFDSFDIDIRRTFEESVAIELPDSAWNQVQLKPSNGGFGLRSTVKHSPAAYISSVFHSVSDECISNSAPIANSIDQFNAVVEEKDRINTSSLLFSRPKQQKLSSAIDRKCLNSIKSQANGAHIVRLNSVSSADASSWITAIPSPGLGLRLSPNEYQILAKWWLGISLFKGDSCCSRCPDVALDPFGLHALTCKRSPDVISRHNTVRDQLREICQWANLRPSIERGAGLGVTDINRRPADILLPDWSLGRPGAIDLTVVHPLSTNNISVASTTARSFLDIAECRKHSSNDSKCAELGWRCLPMAVSVFGEWGKESKDVFSRIGRKLSMLTGSRFSEVRAAIIRKLLVALMRCNARSLLAHKECIIGQEELAIAGKPLRF